MLKWALSFAAVLLIALVCALVFLQSAKKAALDMAENTAEAMASILKIQPQVTVKNTVWVQQSREVLELATQEQKVTEETEFTHTYLGSTKRLKLRAQFTVKAGFNLRRPFRVVLSDDGKVASGDFPAPEILSVEMGGFEALEDSSGYWNYLTPEDRAQAMETLQTQARREARQSGLLEKASAALAGQLEKFGASRGQRWRVQFRREGGEMTNDQ